MSASRRTFVSAWGLVVLLLATGCSEDREDPELIVEDLVVGDGEVAERNLVLTVHYEGWLQSPDGQLFDSSRDRDQPLTFRLSNGCVIDGWVEGLIGMREGGTRRLTIPPELGYGSRGSGGVIPPNATLVFEVELLAVSSPSNACFP